MLFFVFDRESLSDPRVEWDCIEDVKHLLDFLSYFDLFLLLSGDNVPIPELDLEDDLDGFTLFEIDVLVLV